MRRRQDSRQAAMSVEPRARGRDNGLGTVAGFGVGKVRAAAFEAKKRPTRDSLAFLKVVGQGQSNRLDK